MHDMLAASEATDYHDLLIIMVDALDEYREVDGRYSDHRKALMWTLSIWVSFPSRFKPVVASRYFLSVVSEFIFEILV
jgi:hypothetical protein